MEKSSSKENKKAKQNSEIETNKKPTKITIKFPQPPNSITNKSDCSTSAKSQKKEDELLIQLKKNNKKKKKRKDVVEEEEEEQKARPETDEVLIKEMTTKKKKKKKKKVETGNKDKGVKIRKKDGEKEKEEKDEEECVFPTARVTRIIKTNQGSSQSKITAEAVFLINKATEKFLELFSEDAYGCAVEDHKSFVGYKHLASAVSKGKLFEFLSDFVPEKVAAEKALAERNPPTTLPG